MFGHLRRSVSEDAYLSGTLCLTSTSIPHARSNDSGICGRDGYRKLVSHADEPWLRLLLELGFTYGWRKSEITGLRVSNVNLRTGVIRLEDSKNGEPREVTMSTTVRELVRLAVEGKNPDDPLLTRKDGSPVKNFRTKWKNLTKEAGCPGLLVHDLRRSAARELRHAGVAESTIMDMGGWRTREMFKRYAISDNRDVRVAVEKRELAQAEARAKLSHDLSHDPALSAPEDVQTATSTATKRVQ
jgi:integrase